MIYILNLENISPEEKTAKIASLIGELTEIRQELQTVEFSQISLFDQTAENRARNQTIMWWVLSLSHIKNEQNEIVNSKFDKIKIDEISENFIIKKNKVSVYIKI